MQVIPPAYEIDPNCCVQALTAALALVLLMRQRRIRHQQMLASHNASAIQIACSDSQQGDHNGSIV